MASYDVFNGDADGICALVQLRNAEPVDSELITGVKRDIQLLDKISPAAGDKITVLDISLDKNRAGLDKALQAGASVFYVDHHYAGEIPHSGQLTTLINPEPDVCTSLLVNGYLKKAYCAWAVVGAFGDNMKKSAQAAAKSLNVKDSELALLEKLGTYINYNGYGASVEDLLFAPDDLFRALRPYADPFDFLEDRRETFQELEQGYESDFNAAEAIDPQYEKPHAAVFVLPDAPWARRVSGVYSNDLTNRFPDRAHAVLTEKPNGNYLVSVRAPLNNKTGADELCRRFATGGGRAAAAGINDLPDSEMGMFVEQFSDFFRR